MKPYNFQGTLVLFLVATAVPSEAAMAASCFTGSQVVDPAQISADEAAIKADPSKWLLSKGGGLTSAVRNLAASDPDFAATLVSQFKSGSPEQGAAIGSGLGQAAGACRTLPTEAAKIQAAAAAATDANLVASFSSTTGSTQTAATGGGGGGGDGGGGTGVGGASGLATPTTGGGSNAGLAAPATTGTTNSFTNLLTGGTAASSSSISTTTTTTRTVSSSVSTN